MNNTISENKAHLWQIAFFSLNNTSTNLYLAMMGYVSYYANGIAGLGVVLISFILTGMRVFDGITDPVIGYVIDRTNGRFGKFRPFMIMGYIILAVSSLLLYFTTHLVSGWIRVPYFPLVLSITYPITGSVIPSNTLIPVRINDIRTTPSPAIPLA